jgi:hypothetical protein
MVIAETTLVVIMHEVTRLSRGSGYFVHDHGMGWV